MAAENSAEAPINQESTHDLSDIDEKDHSDLVISDPLEPYNRAVFLFNKSVDKLLIRPAAVTYKKVIPDWGKDRVHSAIFNMYEPVRIANAILQTDEGLIAKTVGRFLTNTIIGLGGLIDVAAQADGSLRPKENDFGLTLKHYGVEKGPYFMLPILGPSTIRDTVGVAADYFMDPFNSKLFREEFIIVHTGAAGVDKRYQMLDVTDHIESTSLDEYSTIRSIYWQKR
jgi:phospholipid-binding lipoprotein MlaA